jgi:hypothetical protein
VAAVFIEYLIAGWARMIFSLICADGRLKSGEPAQSTIQMRSGVDG